MSAKVEERHRKLAETIVAACAGNHIEESIAKVLADAMHQARLEEAEWWRYQTHEDALCSPQSCVQCRRIAALKAEVKA